MRKQLLSLFIAGACLFAMSGCSSNKTPNTQTPANTENKNSAIELNVSAAASLKDSLEKINENYKTSTGNTVAVNLGGSGALAKQIKEGAPTDVFISASKKAMAELADNKIVDENDVSILLKNDLVLIVPKENPAKIKTIQDLANLDEKSKISIGEVETVPAGQYAKESLENLKLWEKAQPSIVYAKDVRQVLTYVENSEVVAGFVYKSDALISDKSTIVEVVDEKSHKDIVYLITVIKDSSNAQVAKEYEEFLKSEESIKIFEEFGFKVEK